MCAFATCIRHLHGDRYVERDHGRPGNDKHKQRVYIDVVDPLIEPTFAKPSLLNDAVLGTNGKNKCKNTLQMHLQPQLKECGNSVHYSRQDNSRRCDGRPFGSEVNPPL